MQNCIVLGSQGMVGSAFVAELAKNSDWQVLTPSLAEADVTKLSSLQNFFALYPPAAVINCAVEVDVERCEKEPERALAINSLGAENVVRAAVAVGAKPIIILPSSAYVFGDAVEENLEEAEPRPLNVYGWSKYLAERLVAQAATAAGLPYFIARTGWIYSKDKDTFVDAVAAALLAGEEFLVTDEQVGVFTNAADFAAASCHNFLAPNTVSGVYHLVDDTTPAQSRYEVAQLIAQVLGKESALIKIATATKIFSTPRPRRALLRNTKMSNALPSWITALEQYLRTRYL